MCGFLHVFPMCLDDFLHVFQFFCPCPMLCSFCSSLVDALDVANFSPGFRVLQFAKACYMNSLGAQLFWATRRLRSWRIWMGLRWFNTFFSTGWVGIWRPFQMTSNGSLNLWIPRAFGMFFFMVPCGMWRFSEDKSLLFRFGFPYWGCQLCCGLGHNSLLALQIPLHPDLN